MAIKATNIVHILHQKTYFKGMVQQQIYFLPFLLLKYPTSQQFYLLAMQVTQHLSVYG